MHFYNKIIRGIAISSGENGSIANNVRCIIDAAFVLQRSNHAYGYGANHLHVLSNVWPGYDDKVALNKCRMH